MGVIYNASTVRDSLVLHLDAANPKSYPGTGTTWNDLSGFGNNASILSGEYSSNGYLQNLNNTSNAFAISVPNSTSLQDSLSVTTGGWTIEESIYTYSVVYPQADAGAVASTKAYDTVSTGFDWNHGITNTSFEFGVTSGGAVSAYDKKVAIPLVSPYSDLNYWKLRSMIWDRSTNIVSLYINGVYQGGGSISEVAAQTLYDGGGIVFGSLYGWQHYGRRSLIRIYKRVLSSNEITQNFEALRGRYNI